MCMSLGESILILALVWGPLAPETTTESNDHNCLTFSPPPLGSESTRLTHCIVFLSNLLLTKEKHEEKAGL